MTIMAQAAAPIRLKSKTRHADGPSPSSMHHAPVHKVDARHVDLQQVAVRRHSVIHQEAQVVQLAGSFTCFQWAVQRTKMPTQTKK